MYGSKNHADDDAYHLPVGMKRVGYDAETQRYTFREGDNLWLGEPGSFYGGQMKRAGKAPDATEDGEDEEYYTDDSDPVPPYECAPKPPPKPSTSGTQKKGEWGVPVHTISDTDAKPPDGNGAGAALKRRASRFKEVASSTIVAQGVIRRLTKKKGHARWAPQSDSKYGVGLQEDGKGINNPEGHK